MKGGITSGVIYPRLVAGLARRYVFKNIGGTSAGAIAAGASAAAEYGRQHGNPGAFERLADLPEELGATAAGGDRSRLFTLFQPVPALRRHFEAFASALGRPAGSAAASVLASAMGLQAWLFVVMAVAGGLLLAPFLRQITPDAGWVGLIGAAAAVQAATSVVLWRLAVVHADEGPRGVLSVLGLGVIATILTVPLWGSDASRVQVHAGSGLLIVAALLAVCHAVAALAFFASGLLRRLGGNGYGLCSGLTQAGDPSGQDALTAWLHRYFNELAGLDPDGPPLTFGDLWGGEDPPERRIHLEVMTSAVSQQMAYSIPFRKGTPTFYYDPVEWAALFPPEVMAALARASDRIAGDYGAPAESAAQAPLRPLTREWDLPVVVAIRMSLSFPLLLSAVPLYAVDRSLAHNVAQEKAYEDAGRDAARHRVRATKVWFSDGGIGSNMPLHMFDALLPRHPGFAINLKAPHPDVPIDRERPENPENTGGRIYLPHDNQGGHLQHWPEPDLVPDWESRPPAERAKSPAAGLASFLWSIVGTMQNWRDQIAFPAPGYRDRIVQISQRPDEGGLNLRMSEETIGALALAGEMAAHRLIGRFHPAGREQGRGWENQRRVRLTTFLGTMQPACVDLAETARATGSWLWLLNDATGYKDRAPNRAEAQRVLDGLVQIGKATPPMRGSTRPRSLEDVSPRPVPLVRLVPRI
ncbi:patatin-like phospholipase family protein [Mitsuaria sp. GD03876]|nr:patatin-like phospholipase family protein [Mitsuaria sp. GD03876]MDH0862913.1 patatin-like phospholipase family protein [Mitsuaria sp. GD03876]